MFDDLDIKQKEVNLEDYLNKRFYDDILKSNFLNDLNEMIKVQGAINIDVDDIKQISNSLLVGTLSKSFDDLNFILNINKINDYEPTDCIIKITCNENANIKEINYIIDKIRDLYPGINCIFAIAINPNLNNKYKIQALFTFHEDINNGKYDNEEDLLYAIMKYCIEENKISVNLIQNKFTLGFNRTSKLINKLEELKIISEKENSNPRKILINDLNLIKKLIYKK